MFNLDLENAEETGVKLPTSVGSQKKQQNSRKVSISASLIMLNILIVWITTNCGTFFKRWEYQTTLPATLLVYNLYAEYIMQNARMDEAQAGIQIAGRNSNNLRYADDMTLTSESKEELNTLLMKVKEESRKVGLKLSIQKTKIMASGPIMGNR